MLSQLNLGVRRTRAYIKSDVVGGARGESRSSWSDTLSTAMARSLWQATLAQGACGRAVEIAMESLGKPLSRLPLGGRHPSAPGHVRRGLATRHAAHGTRRLTCVAADERVIDCSLRSHSITAFAAELGR